MERSHTSLVISHSSHYKGLPPLSKFTRFPLDPVYKFPILNRTASTDGHISLNDFIQTDQVDIKKSIVTLQERSPFTMGNESSNQDISLSFFSDEVIFNPDDSQMSKIEWEDKNLISFEEAFVSTPISDINSAIAELIPENQSSLLKKQMKDEIIPDECSKQAPSRVFLSGSTASKSILASCPGFPYLNSSKPDFPDRASPLYRKVVVCEKCEDTIGILSSVAACGYSTAPTINYSSLPGKTRGGISYTSGDVFSLLFSAAVARTLVKQSAVWVSCGFEHCVAIVESGKVFSWGYGASGCLGHGSLWTYTSPTMIDGLEGVYVECGAYHTAVVSPERELWVWGRSDVDQLGVPKEELKNDDMGFVALEPIRHPLRDVVAVACGEAHTLTLSSYGKIASFGWDDQGQLGHSPTTSLVESNENFLKIACGGCFSVALTRELKVFVWGNGERGQLGLGKDVLRIDVPTCVNLNENAIDVICGDTFVLCLCESGKVLGWGYGTAEDFQGEFTSGSDIICFLPRELSELDIAHRFLLKK